MSKRLQVMMSEDDWQMLRQTARRQGVTVSEWARRTLAAAWRREPSGDLGPKLQAVREAAKHDFPTADIDGMLAEIERGYLAPKSAP